MECQPLEYFLPLVGTRHTDPDDGLTYETTDVKTNRHGYIVAYRQRYYKGKALGKVDGPFHVADIFKYTKTNIETLYQLTGVKGKAPQPSMEAEEMRNSSLPSHGNKRKRLEAPQR